MQQERLIRLFVSSTFLDMHGEREILVKHVFPEVRRLARQREVEFVEVDLRWGVTEKESESGETLRLCLAEIDHSRPYFLGILGERYGWIPDEIPAPLLEHYPWLRDHHEKTTSVTELEILHGVLDHPRDSSRAQFYLRDPACSREIGGSTESADRGEALGLLKQRIVASGHPVRENYQDPDEFGRLVLADLTRLIDELFPAGSAPDPLDREAAEHEAFGRARARVYIGRDEYFDRLDRHAAGNAPPLVLLGESGSGKSALLANWVDRYRQAHPGAFVLVHYIGSTPASADHVALLSRILGEIRRRYGIPNEIPDRPEALRAEFPNWLAMAAARGPFVLVLDAANQLEDREGAPDLLWLPEFIPPEVRLVLSTLPGRSLGALERRGWPAFSVEPLDPRERRELISRYLAPYGKRLDQKHVDRIAGAAQSAHPLYLRALVEELRVFGVHEELDARIDHYLEAPDAPRLFARILARLEEDYEKERPGLVAAAMSSLWAARRGLTEAELLELLETPRAVWSRLYLALEQSLVSRSGLLTFFHDFLRQAVREKYLDTTEKEEAAHLALGELFERRSPDARQTDELPWQLSRAREWPRLASLLADLEFFGRAWQANEFEVKARWAEVESNSDFTMIGAYQPVLDAPESHPDHAWPIATLLNDTGRPEESLRLMSILVEHSRRTGDRDNLQAALGYQAVILRARGDLDDAMALLEEQERICRELENKDGLQWGLGAQAAILRARGELDDAMALHKEKERICRELGNKHELSAALGNQAVIFRARGELDGAMALLKEAERICRELGNKAGLQAVLENQAGMLHDRGDLDGAVALHKEAERVCWELGDKELLQTVLGNRGAILQSRGDLDGAMALYKEKERICRELGNKDGLQSALGKQALILGSRGDLDGAMALLKEQERICRELGNKAGLSAALGDQALILQAHGELDGAMALHKEQERICRELGNKDGLQGALGNQALIHRKRGDLDRAMALHREQERICRQLGNKSGLQASLGNLALVLQIRGDLDGAMALHKEKERICRELGYKKGLSVALANEALILRKRGDLAGAMTLNKEVERICRELGNTAELQAALGNQAVILQLRGDLDGATALLEEQEQICRELGNKAGLQAALGNQALILKDRGDLDGAMALLEEQEQICRELGRKTELINATFNKALLLLIERRDPRSARPAIEEVIQILVETGQRPDLLEQARRMLAEIRSRLSS